MIVFNTAFNTAGNDHRTRLSTDLSLGNNLLMEVADHHIRFFGDGKRLALHKGTQLFLRLLLVKQRIIFHRLFQPIESVDRRIVFQHIQNKAFLNRLLHGVYVERAMFNLTGIHICITEGFQRLILRRSGKGKV